MKDFQMTIFTKSKWSGCQTSFTNIWDVILMILSIPEIVVCD